MTAGYMYVSVRGGGRDDCWVHVCECAGWRA